MKTYVTPSRYLRVASVPVALAQTELRRGCQITVCKIVLKLGQVLRIRALALSILRSLSPGQTPVYTNSALGIASVGVCIGAVTGGAATVRGASIGTFALNGFGYHDITSPGNYSVVVSNNTSNMDLALAVTGSALLYS